MAQLKRKIRRYVPYCVQRWHGQLHRLFSFVVMRAAFYIFSCFPLENKVIASTFDGLKYGDNPRYIVEELHKINPCIDIVWIKDDHYSYDVPDWIRTISRRKHNLRRVYEYATAKVWIDTHRLQWFFWKRKSQIFIETWHGGLGIKKLDGDVPKFRDNHELMDEVKTMCMCADLFVSNSDHLTNVYRSAFSYKGAIWKIGYPKNDILFHHLPQAKKNVYEEYAIPDDCRLIAYAPTFRDGSGMGNLNWDVYDIDFDRLLQELSKKTGEKWTVIVKFHPRLLDYKNTIIKWSESIVDATEYPDMQELIMAADAFISDYSSCIFDAALRNIPCFTFATDFEEYKGGRGVYYEMEELPFPYARNNDELMQNVRDFDYEAYLQRWETFKVRTGLYETGHAGKDIANLINEYINGNREPLESIKNGQ